MDLKKNKVIIIMGATGTGKSQLSIKLAKRFPVEIINSDKMQVYKGLDVVTNKVTEAERQSVPHHLIGMVEDPDTDFTALHFSYEALSVIDKIVGSGQVPVIVGGSNSFIEALVEDPIIKFKTRYDCCFIWIDVSLPLLLSHTPKRVDQMVDAGMIEEVRGIFNPDADYGRGLRRAICVPELDKYFRTETELDKISREKLLASAIQEIKDNACELVHRQVGKIRRLKEECGWAIHRIDATTAFKKGSTLKEAEIAWEESVVQPCMQKVIQFVYNYGDNILPERNLSPAFASDDPLEV